MIDPATPTVQFDIRLGESFKFIDVELEGVAAYLSRLGLSNEAISGTTVLISSDEIEAGEAGHLLFGDASKRFARLFLGSYKRATKDQSRKEASLTTTALGSKTLAHELAHVKQYEAETMPPANHPDCFLPWEQQPWEIEAVTAEEEYFDLVRSGQLDLLVAAHYRD